MSRIGKTPIKLLEGVKVKINKQKVTVSGEKGTLEYVMRSGISTQEKNGELIVSRKDDSKQQKSFHGLTRALLSNMVQGVSEGFSRTLNVIGTGFSAEVIGQWLRLNVGFSHEIMLEIPEDLTVEAKTIPRREQGPLGIQVMIKVFGISKEDVGKFAAEIRACRPPAPNIKGKGIRWEGEYVKIVSKAGTA